MLPMLMLPLCITFSQSIQQMPAAATPGLLTVTYTEGTDGGNYSPKHCSAIWIQDATGRFVKTLFAQAGTRQQHLNNWETATTAYGSVYNKVDAISSATVNSFGTRTCTWNGTNLASPRAVLPDGVYTLKMELTCRNNTGNLATFTFTKGPTAQPQTPPNQPSFSNVSIRWVPNPTAIDEVKLEKMYTVSPNPVKTSFLVKGADIVSVELFSIAGKRIKTTNETKMNIGSLAKGNYIAVITTKNGTFSKNIIKQ